MTLQVIEGVRDLVFRYIDAINQVDMDAFGECFAEDGVWDVAGHFKITGRQAIKAKLSEEHHQFRWVFQILSSTQVLVALPDMARARTYFSVHGSREDRGFRTLGIYHDVCVKTNNHWYFASRRFDGLYIGAADLSTPPTNRLAPLNEFISHDATALCSSPAPTP